MKTSLKYNREEGGILLMCLTVVTLVTVFSLAGYMILSSSEAKNVSRSQSWNAAIPACEAGVEEALEHLNSNCVSNFFNSGVVNFTADGWGTTNAGAKNGICKVHQVYGTNSSYYYDVFIWTNDVLHPEIHARGYSPAVSAALPNPVFATATVNIGSYSTISRRLSVIADPLAVFQDALLTKGPLDLSGNNVTIDSFDPSVAPGGIYSTNYRDAKGNIATASIVDSLNVGNANVYGTVATPYGGSITVNSQGSVGSLDWQNSGENGIQPGWSRDDLNVNIKDAQMPANFNAGLTPLQNITITNYFTNYVRTTNSAVLTYPTGYDLVLTNTTDETSSSYPSAGIYTGVVQTNLVTTNTASYPSAGTYVGAVTPTTTYVSTVENPSSGSYVGTVSQVTVTVRNATSAPADGTYVAGTLKQTGSANSGYKYTYDQIQYSYYQITGYSYSAIRDYTYHKITGYQGVTFNTPVATNTVAKYDYDFQTSGDYEVDTLSGNIYIAGNVRILVDSSINITGNGGITIAQGASLIIYMKGASASIGGNGVANNNYDATSFTYVGLPSNTSVSIGGNGSFTGTIYAPEADLTLHGGGNNNTIDFTGAAVCNSVHMTGNFNLHYPENLNKGDQVAAYVVRLWTEE